MTGFFRFVRSSGFEGGLLDLTPLNPVVVSWATPRSRIPMARHCDTNQAKDKAAYKDKCASVKDYFCAVYGKVAEPMKEADL